MRMILEAWCRCFSNMVPSTSFRCIIVAGLASVSSQAEAASNQDFPPIKLRGYGTLSGTVTTAAIDDQSTSVLKIVCEDEAKAKLVQAKYLSDLQILPGVRPLTIQGKEGDLPGYALETTLAILAARDGATVYILSATSPNALGKLESGDFAPQHGTLSFKPEADVPMYLDRFDKYGFRFYMSPYSTPEKQNEYDLTQEYDYAAQQDHSGMQFWADTNKVNTAEGLTNEAFWIWGPQAARDRNVPLGININAGFEAPVWMLNRYRDQAAVKMPGYVGCFYDTGVYNLGAPGWMSWAATTGEDCLLGVMQQDVRRLAAFPNVTSFMELHAETQHGCPDIFLEYGPTADASYSRFLQQKYTTIKALNDAWQTEFKSWPEVRVPELVTFFGYGPQAIDLTGKWRIGYEPVDGQIHTVTEIQGFIDEKTLKPNGVPDDWFSESFQDSAWPQLTAPGDDTQTLLPRWPAVFRRNFDVPPGWTNSHPKSWIYVWDLNRGGPGDEIKAALNGQVLGTSPLHGGGVPHMAVFETDQTLREGKNLIAIRTPQGRINYKVYITSEEPVTYPNLGDAKNAQWADFIDWDLWLRSDGIRKGMEMVRQVDANRPIMLMSPGQYAALSKDYAKKYGGDFHDTGGMGGWWNDVLPALMRGVGMPISVEPGNPAHSIPEFQNGFGNWITEGVNAVDYFLTIGDVLFDPALKDYFEKNLKVLKLMGKYHAPLAEVAGLYSDRTPKLMGYPWDCDGFAPDPHPFLGGGYVSGFNCRDSYRTSYESDAVTESSFLPGGDASRYRIITDSDTAVMDEATISAIEQYVRNGGIFVTYGETGRHLPGKKDAWPIERLTGYHVADQSINNTALILADGQKVFSPEWATNLEGGGMALEKVAPDGVDLLQWSSGGVAAGMRPLGKGYVIDLGCRVSREMTGQMFAEIFKWQNVAPIPAHVEPASDKEKFRHFVSNNGLYDVWVIWNIDKAQPLAIDLVFSDTLNPTWGYVVKDGSKIAIDKQRLSLKIPPGETAFYLTPRSDIAAASTEWFTMQRSWWQGTAAPTMAPLPTAPHKWSVDLSDDWAFKPVTDKDTVDSLIAPTVDDSKWDRLAMGIWNFTPGHKDVRHAVLRKHVTVPATWTKGEPTFWLRSWDGDTFRNAAQIYIDGKPLFEKPTSHGAEGVNPDGVLKPGTTHLVAVDIDGKTTVDGAMGTAWLWFWPDPVSAIDLSGKWESSLDGLTFDAQVDIPGAFVAKIIRTHVPVPLTNQNQRVVIDLKTEGPIHTVIVNGFLVARHHHNIGDHWQLDITPWIQFGRTNEIQLAADGDKTVSKAALNFYNPGTYP